MKRIVLPIITIVILSTGCVQNRMSSMADIDNNISATQKEQYTIDKTENDCISKEYSTQGIDECTFKAIDAWNKEIDKYLALLKNITSKEDYENIQLSQQKWESYKNSEIIVYGLIQQKQGTMFQNISTGFQKNLIKQRALNLKSLYETLQN